VLLFRISPQFVEHDELWIPPGGGIEPGESAEQAAKRELREETEFNYSGLSACVWTRRHIATWGGRRYDTRESYFVCRLPEVRPRPVFSDDNEKAAVVAHAWWSAGEITRSSAVFAPRRLGHLLPSLLTAPPPGPPLHIED
jgi:ADP-ribose pyrophosphatase YjhB (NUDIX family)